MQRRTPPTRQPASRAVHWPTLRPVRLAVLAIGISLPGQHRGAAWRTEGELVCRDGVCTTLAWSDDGAWIASGGALGEVLLVDAATGRIVHELPVSNGPIGRVSFSPAAPLLAVVGDEVSLWSPADGLRSITWPCGSRRAFAWRADGGACAFVDDRGDLVVVDAARLRTLHTVPLPARTPVTALALDASGERIAVATAQGCRWVFEVSSGERIDTLTRATGFIGLAWRPDGQLVAASSWYLFGLDGDVQTFAAEASAFDLLANGTTGVAFGGGTATICREHAEPQQVLAGGPVALGPAGRSFAIAERGMLRIEGGAYGPRVTTLPHRSEPPTGRLSGDGRWFAALPPGGQLRLWDVDLGVERPVTAGIHGELSATADGDRFLVTTPRPGGRLVLQAWSARSLVAGFATPERTLLIDAAAAPAPRLLFSPDARWLTAGALGIDRFAGAPVWQYRSPDRGQLVGMFVSNDGLLRLALTAGPPRLSVVAASDARLYQQPIGSVRGLQLSPNCQHVLIRSPHELRVLRAIDLGQLWQAEVDCIDAAWLDDDRVVTLQAEPPLLELMRANGVSHQFDLNRPARGLSVAATCGRVAAVLDDRIVVLRAPR